MKHPYLTKKRALQEPVTTFLNIFLALCLLSISALSGAADVPFAFKTPEQEQRYQDLTEQLRCLVCQNQSLADSHADLAQDLRNEVYQMIMQGQDNEQIVEFLVTRYGDFVLYNPPLKKGTLLLWAGPFILLLGALLFVYRYARRSAQSPAPEISTAFLGTPWAESRPSQAGAWLDRASEKSMREEV